MTGRKLPGWAWVIIGLAVVFVLYVLLTMVPVFQTEASAHQGGAPHHRQRRARVHTVKSMHRLKVEPRLNGQCKAGSGQARTKTLTQIWLFSQYLRVKWCYNGNRVYNVSWQNDQDRNWFTHWHATYFSPPVTGGGKLYRYRRVKLEWEACAPIFNICANKNTYVAITIRKDGTSTVGSGWA